MNLQGRIESILRQAFCQPIPFRISAQNLNVFCFGYPIGLQGERKTEANFRPQIMTQCAGSPYVGFGWPKTVSLFYIRMVPSEKKTKEETRCIPETRARADYPQEPGTVNVQ